MPIEIRELVIKASIGEDEPASTDTSNTGTEGDYDTTDIINRCVEKVMEILHQKRER